MEPQQNQTPNPFIASKALGDLASQCLPQPVYHSLLFTVLEPPCSLLCEKTQRSPQPQSSPQALSSAFKDTLCSQVDGWLFLIHQLSEVSLTPRLAQILQVQNLLIPPISFL